MGFYFSLRQHILVPHMIQHCQAVPATLSNMGLQRFGALADCVLCFLFIIDSRFLVIGFARSLWYLISFARLCQLPMDFSSSWLSAPWRSQSKSLAVMCVPWPQSSFGTLSTNQPKFAMLLIGWRLFGLNNCICHWSVLRFFLVFVLVVCPLALCFFFCSGWAVLPEGP